MTKTNGMTHPQDDQDDVSLLQDAARRVISWLLLGALAATFASVGALLYVVLSDRASADPELAIEKRVELLGGACRYGEVGDGIWWNAKYPHAIDMRDGCGLLAVSFITPRAGAMSTGWRLAYTTLGQARVDAVFPIVDAEQALPRFSGESCDPASMSGCLGRGRGVQTARGLSLGYVLEDTIEPLVLGLEAGAFVYEGAWTVAIEPEPHGAYARGPWMTMQFEGWQATPFVGATARYGYLMAMARVYGRVRAAEHGCGGCSGVANRSATQFLLGMSIPF